jgi:CheY-like chemotaxis protein
VLGLAELLQATSLDGQQRAWLETLHRSGVLLLSILNGILDFSKIEAGRLVLESIPLDLRELVGEVGSLFEPLAREKGLILRAEVDPGLPTLLLGDPVRLRQVLSNLVSNALKFTAVGSVAMRVRVVGLVSGLQRVRVEVQDTGIGLSEADRARLFVPFSQVDPSTTRRFGGTGLGLVISQAIVEAMGGRIEVESAPGVGATFSFQLALGVPLAPEARAPRPEAVGLRGAVLVAEDNPVNALVARLMLRGLGLEVAEVRDGQQAVEAVRARAFDLVLMDLHMPVLDGLAATRAIRAGERGHLPIVALTADALPEDRARCLAEGMDDYLSKPLRRAELEQVLRRWLTTRSAA